MADNHPFHISVKCSLHGIWWLLMLPVFLGGSLFCGILYGFAPKLINVISVIFRRHGLPINILNTYAPYLHRFPFWDRFFSSDLCEIRSLMIVGDLNFTLCPDEVWGGGRKMDPLADFIKNHLLIRNFIDVAPSVLTHTWDNGRSFRAFIAKHIDGVIIHANIIDAMGMPYLSIGNDFISDHRPIFIQWRHK